MGNGESNNKNNRFELINDRAVPVKSFNVGSREKAKRKVLKTRKKESKSIQVRAKASFSPARMKISKDLSLPIIKSEKEISSGSFFKDSGNQDKYWYIPAIEISKPKNKALFKCWIEKEDVPNQDGELKDIYHGRILFSYNFKEPDVDDKLTDDNKKLKQIVLNLEEAVLQFKHYDDAENGYSEETIEGKVDKEKNEISFELKDNYLKIVYSHLSNPTNKDDKDDSSLVLVLNTVFDGYREAKKVTAKINKKVLRTVSKPQTLDRVAKMKKSNLNRFTK